MTIPGLSSGIWDWVPPPGIKPRPPALGTQGLSHWTTGKSPYMFFLVLTAFKWYEDDGSAKHCGLRYYILYFFENLESWNTKAIMGHKEHWILRHMLKFLHVLWYNSAKDYFSLHFNEFSVVFFFFSLCLFREFRFLDLELSLSWDKSLRWETRSFS